MTEPIERIKVLEGLLVEAAAIIEWEFGPLWDCKPVDIEPIELLRRIISALPDGAYKPMRSPARPD